MNKKQGKLFAKSLIAACLMTVGSVAIVSAATVSQFRSNGSKACTTGYFGPDNSGYLTMCIYTNTNNTVTPGTDPTSVFLEYYIYNNNGWSSGYGTVPPLVVRFSPSQVTLSVNPASVPGYFQEGNLTGNISLTWDRTNLWSNQSSGTIHTTYGNIRQSSNGTWEDDSANSKGTVFGYGYTTPSGSIGKSKNMYIVIDK